MTNPQPTPEVQSGFALLESGTFSAARRAFNAVLTRPGADQTSLIRACFGRAIANLGLRSFPNVINDLLFLERVGTHELNVHELRSTQNDRLLLWACASVETEGDPSARRKLEAALDLASSSAISVDSPRYSAFLTCFARLEYASTLIACEDRTAAASQLQTVTRIMDEDQDGWLFEICRLTRLRVEAELSESAGSAVLQLTRLLSILFQLNSKDAGCDKLWLWTFTASTHSQLLGKLLREISPYHSQTLGKRARVQVRDSLSSLEGLLSSRSSDLDRGVFDNVSIGFQYYRALYQLSVGERSAALICARECVAQARAATMGARLSYRSRSNMATASLLLARSAHAAVLLTGAQLSSELDGAFSDALTAARDLTREANLSPTIWRNVWAIEDDWGDAQGDLMNTPLQVGLYALAVEASGCRLKAIVASGLPWYEEEVRACLDYILAKSLWILEEDKTEYVWSFLNSAVSAILSYSHKDADQHLSVTAARRIACLSDYSVPIMAVLADVRHPAWLRSDKSVWEIGSDFLPLISGAWSSLPLQEARAYVELFEQFAAPPYRGGAMIVADVITLRSLALSFYRDWTLLELTFGEHGGDQWVLNALANLKDNRLIVLDGNSRWIHALNSMGCLHLDTLDQVRDYGVFFSSSLRADRGRFAVIESSDQLMLVRTLPPRIQEAFEGTLEVRSSRPGLYSMTALVMYDQALFRTEIQILASGRVEMTDDDVLAENLVLSREEYLGPWRLPLPIHNH